MKLALFGLGYVGTVSVGCLSAQGHVVVGVDSNITKVDMINDGVSPIIEKDIEEIIRNSVNSGRLSATTDSESAVVASDVSIVCVGTPSGLDGRLDLSYVRRVCEEIGAALKSKDYHLVVVRSTVLPGSMKEIIIPVLEESSGKKAGLDFGVCFNPEFLREGTAVYDFLNPPKIVIGRIDAKSGNLLSSIYKDIDAESIITDIEIAEMVKYVDNSWHALKVGYANEVGNICKAIGMDGHKVMDIFCKDNKLNLSPYYLKPGFAFGGSCLPKDIKALIHKSKALGLDLPILNAVLPSNRKQIENGLNLIIRKGNKKVGILGFSFKAGTDDLRDSPMVEVIERLIGKGYDVKVYDENVKLASLKGANRDFVLSHIPHIAHLMADSIQELLDHAETIVIGNKSEEFMEIFKLKRQGQTIVDLVRIINDVSTLNDYEGICW